MKSNRWTRTLIGSAALLASALTAATARADEFFYSGDHGPGFWGETPGWEACARSTEPGARQTPIDLRDATPDAKLQPLALHLEKTEISLVDNGHTIEQEFENGSHLELDGAEYELTQFHFHTLSEHTLDGHRGVMELHAVFKNKKDNSLAVVGELYDIGTSSPFLEKLLAAGLPTKAGEKVHSAQAIDLAEGLTDPGAYYTYAGSLTTPPCSETVTWFVLKHPATLSAAQFEAFNRVLGDNFRPLQERNGRIVRSTVGRDDH